MEREVERRHRERGEKRQVKDNRSQTKASEPVPLQVLSNGRGGQAGTNGL